jgi:hypothetical protein
LVADAHEWTDGLADDSDEEFDEPELLGAGAGSMW